MQTSNFAQSVSSREADAQDDGQPLLPRVPVPMLPFQMMNQKHIVQQSRNANAQLHAATTVNQQSVQMDNYDVSLQQINSRYSALQGIQTSANTSTLSNHQNEDESPLMTSSQKQILTVKRERKRNFLPAIYNSANVSPGQRGKLPRHMQSPSTQIFEQCVMNEYPTLATASNTISVNKMHQKHCAEIADDQIRSLQEQSSYPLGMDTSISTDQRVTARNNHNESVLTGEGMQQANSDVWNFQPNEKQSPENSYIFDAPKQPGRTKQNLGRFRINQSSTVMKNKFQYGSSLNQKIKQASEHSTPKLNHRYQSSDIFALKQISLEQSKKDLLLQFQSSTVKNADQAYRRDRLLVKSVDISDFLERSVRKPRRRYQSMLQSQQIAKAAEGKGAQSILAAPTKTETVMELMSPANKSKINYMMDQSNGEKQPLGATQEGDSMVNTLMGDSPFLNSRQNLAKSTFRTNQSPALQIQTQNMTEMNSRNSRAPESPNIIINKSLAKLQHTTSLAFDRTNPSSPLLLKNDTRLIQDSLDKTDQKFKVERILTQKIKDVDDTNPLDEQDETMKSHLIETDHEQSPKALKLSYDQAAMSQISNVLQNSKLDATFSYQQQRVQTGSELGSNLGTNDDVTSDLYTKREIDVLRAKIQKRITLQQKDDLQNEIDLKTYHPEIEASKTGPQRLNMDKTSRKGVMKILQDNKQKLRQTRQEMIAEIKNQKLQQLQSQPSQQSLGSPTRSMMRAHQVQTETSEAHLRSSNKNKGTDDAVLKSKVFERLSKGSTALGNKDDIVSQMSMITDEKSHGLYHTKLLKKQAMLEKSRQKTLSQATTVHKKDRFISSQGEPSEIEYQQPKSKKTQEEKDKETKKRLWLYQIDQVEQEALCKDEDQDLLHGILKFKTKKHIQANQRKRQSQSEIKFNNKEPKPLTEQEQEEANQRMYHSIANTFKKRTEDGQLRLMTRKSMQALLEQLTQEQKLKLAAMKPMYGEISFDRAASDIQAELVESLHLVANRDPRHLEVQKGLSLLYRHEPEKTQDELDDQKMQMKIESYVQRLTAEAHSIESDEMGFYSSKIPSLSLDRGGFSMHKAMSVNQRRVGMVLSPAPSPFLKLGKVNSVQPGQSLVDTFSPLKRKITMKMNLSVESVDTPSVVSKRKITFDQLEKMASKRDEQRENQKYPLKYLTEDTTDDFDTHTIATQLYDLANFYKVNKNAISNIYTEKNKKDHRLTYLLECLDDMEVILPVLNQVQLDGTLYLKEYLLGDGHAKGLKTACTLQTSLCSKVLIDNCGLSETGLADIMAGLQELEVLKQLVIRRSKINLASIPYLLNIQDKIFPQNLMVLKVEHCQIDKETTLALVQGLRQKSYIRTLSLIRVAFNPESIAELCGFLGHRSYIEELDLSDNRLEPKLFLPIVKTLAECKHLKSVNLSWNLLLENARGPQIGTCIKEEKLVYGRADEPIEFPEEVDDKPPVLEVDQQSELQVETSRSASEEKPARSVKIDKTSDSSHSVPASEKLPPTPVQAQTQQIPNLNLTSLSKTELSTLNTGSGRSPNAKSKNLDVVPRMSPEEEELAGYLKSIVKCQAMQHVDFSDCGLTEAILLGISKSVSISNSLVSVHLSGNPGLKDFVMRKIEARLKATYEVPLRHQTFKPLLRLYDQTHGIQESYKEDESPQKNQRRSILDDIIERESLDSGSLELQQSEKHRLHPSKLKEQLFFKTLLREKEALVSADDGKLSRDHGRHFSVSRILGHELDMPGVSEWEVKKHSQQQCWVCDRKQFTWFFWSSEYGEYEQNRLNLLTAQEKDKVVDVVFRDRQTNNLRSHRRTMLDKRLATPRITEKYDHQAGAVIEIDSERESVDISNDDSSDHGANDFVSEEYGSDSEADNSQLKMDKDNKQWVKPKKQAMILKRSLKGPAILGAFNNWQPQPMIKVSNLARILDKRPKPDFVQECINARKCRPNITSIKEMTAREKTNYYARKDAHLASYTKPEVWGPIISGFLKDNFKSTRIVGAANFEIFSPRTVYVGGAFLDMGKQNYIVQNSSKLYFHETTVGLRRENIPMHLKANPNTVMKLREVDVFKYWLRDKPETLEKAYEADFYMNKIGQIVKDQGTQADLKVTFVKNYDFLKDVFLSLTINSGTFPYMGMSDFTRFMSQIKIIDQKMDQSLISFYTSNVKSKNTDARTIKGQHTSVLNRAEFVEALLRIAIKKFKDDNPNGAMVTIEECAETIIKEHIRPNFVPGPWQVFRDEELWTREVNLVLHDNRAGLKTIYAKYAAKGLNKIEMGVAIKILTTETSVRLNKFDALYCYAMSLMTCTDLLKLTHNKVMHMGYEEFLEMICRAADLHFTGSDQENSLALWEKVMLILEELFLMVPDCEPVLPQWMEEADEPDTDPETVQAPLQKLKVMTSTLYSNEFTSGRVLPDDDDDYFKQ